MEDLHVQLKKDPNVLGKYILIAQKECGVTEEAWECCEAEECNYHYHHLAVKETKDTTKVDIILDGSVTSEESSHNDCLYKGPQLF